MFSTEDLAGFLQVTAWRGAVGKGAEGNQAQSLQPPDGGRGGCRIVPYVLLNPFRKGFSRTESEVRNFLASFPLPRAFPRHT